MTGELDRKVDIFGINIEGQTKLNEKWSKTEFLFEIRNNSINKKSDYPKIPSIFRTLFRDESNLKKVKSRASFIPWTPNRRMEASPKFRSFSGFHITMDSEVPSSWK